MEDFTFAEFKEEIFDMADEVAGNDKLTKFLFKVAFIARAIEVLGFSDDINIKVVNEEN